MDKNLFFYELEGRGYIFQNKKWDEAKHRFEDDMLNMAWEMWSSAKHSVKAQAVPYESCSTKSHEIIINETKSELIDGYDIAKEDEYLLESLVYRGVCIGKAQAAPEGFVLVEKTKLMQIIGSAAIIEPITRGNPLMSKYKTELDFILSTVRAMIEAQEPAND